MDVEGILAMRRKVKQASGSCQGRARPDSSTRRPATTVGEGAHPHPRPRPKDDEPDRFNRGSGSEPTPPPKSSKPTDLEPIRHEKGKHLCPNLYTTDSSKNLWCHPELGVELCRHNIRAVDMAYLSSRSAVELANSAFTDLARLPAVIESLKNKARGYEEMQTRAEEYERRCHSLTRELAQLKLDCDTSRKQLEEQLDSVMKELKAEISSGRRFMETLGGQRFMKQEIENAISKFKGSVEFIEAVQEASVPAFDACLDYCRKRLTDSGRFPGEKFEFLDPNWVEMIEGDPTATLVSQGTSILHSSPEDDTMDLGGEDAI